MCPPSAPDPFDDFDKFSHLIEHPADDEKPSEPPAQAADAAGPALHDVGQDVLHSHSAEAVAVEGVQGGKPVRLRERMFDDSEQKIVSGRLWLVSFTDLFSIMLCFFLLIFATRDIDLTKVGKPTTIDPPGPKGVEQKIAASGIDMASNISRVEYGDGANLDYLQGVLSKSLEQAQLQNDVSVVKAKTQLKLVLDSEKLFESPQRLGVEGSSIAKRMAERLVRLSNKFAVVYVSQNEAEWAEGLDASATFAAALRDAGYRKPFAVLVEGSGQGPKIEIRVEADDGQLR